MMQIHTAAAALCAVLLAACQPGSSPVGASTDASTEAGADQKSSWSLAKLFGAEKKAVATVKMPALALVNDAALHVLGELAIPPNQIEAGLIFAADLGDAWAFGVSGEKQVVQLMTDEKQRPAYLAAIAAQKNTASPLVAPVVAHNEKCASIPVADRPAIEKCVHEGVVRLGALAVLAIAAQPVAGWPVNIVFGSRGEKEIGRKYAQSRVGIAEAANLLATDLVTVLGERTLRDPEAAKLEIVKTIYAAPLEKLESVRQTAKATAQRAAAAIQFDETGVKGAAFIANGTRYEFTPDGPAIKRAGINWFGNGNAISGKAYDLALESAVSASIQQQTGTEGSTSVASKQTGTASAGVK